MTVYVDAEVVGTVTGITVTDDGTYYVFASGGTSLMKVKKSDGSLYIAGGLADNQTL